MELLKAHDQQTAAPLDAVRPDAPPGLAMVVSKMMAKTPAERYQTPDEAAEALLPFTETAPPASPTDNPPLKRRRREKRVRVAVALGACLALVAVAAYVVRVQTDNGEVMIESEVGGISVDIERDGETVKDGWQIRQGADNRWVVRSGIVNVKLPAELRGEFTLEQDTAKLVRDGTIVVKITRKAKATPSVVAEDRDRAAAEWVVEQGGFVSCILASGRRLSRREDSSRAAIRSVVNLY